MPYPNEHAARLKEPGQFDSFARENNMGGDGIDFIYGIKGGRSEIQAIRFDKKKFTPEEARRWLKDHDFHPIDFELASEPLKAAATQDEKKAQEARSKKYNIAIKEGGNVTKPSEWANVSDDDFLDPVNYRYPCPNADQTQAAAAYWGKPENEAQYSSEEKGVINRRLAEFEKKFQIAGYAKASWAGGDDIAGAIHEFAIHAASRLIGAVDDPKADGYRWLVQVIEAGPDKQGLANYPFGILREAAPLYEGAKVFALSQGQHASPANPYGKSVRDLVGWLSGVRSNDTGIEAKLNILRTASWLRDMIVDSFERGKQDLVGLSHDILAKMRAGSSPRDVEKIVRVDSVDVVYDPIAGGKFIRMAAAASKAAGQKEEPMFKSLLAALTKLRPDLKTQIEALEAKGDAVTEEEIINLVTQVTGARNPDLDKLSSILEKLTTSNRDQTTQQVQEIVNAFTKKLEDNEKLTACAQILIDEMAAANLPEILRSRIKRQFSGKIFELEALKAAIREEKEIADKLSGSGTPHDVGMPRAEVGTEEPERLQAAMDKLLEVSVDEKFKDIKAFRSLRAAYTRITGDSELRGVPTREGEKLGRAFMEFMRLPAAYSTSSFSFVLGNSLYRRLLKEYMAVDYRENVLLSFVRNAPDFRTMEIIQVGYFGDLPTITPETVDYPELTMPTDIEATYSVIQKGGILTVTRAAMLADDLRSIAQLVSKVGRAARRTHAKRAWNMIINNATFDGDSTALFDASHGNLGAVALTLDATGIATLTNRLKAMYAQAEQDSAEIMGLIPKYLWCDRTHLEIAQGLNSPWPGASTPNPHAGRFGANHENIICNPLFTDTDDWGLIADANDVELLEAAYINGRTEPEFFLADNPTIGQMFVADKIQYKIRHEYEVEIADFRGFDKSVV
jgi:hypothetical protein